MTNHFFSTRDITGLNVVFLRMVRRYAMQGDPAIVEHALGIDPALQVRLRHASLDRLNEFCGSLRHVLFRPRTSVCDLPVNAIPNDSAVDIDAVFTTPGNFGPVFDEVRDLVTSYYMFASNLVRTVPEICVDILGVDRRCVKILGSLSNYQTSVISRLYGGQIVPSVSLDFLCSPTFSEGLEQFQTSLVSAISRRIDYISQNHASA